MKQDWSGFWNEHWQKRDLGDKIACNSKKAEYLMHILWNRSEFIKKRKLEIGCGTCFHIRIMANVCKEWAKNYVGIDVSETAVRIANRWKINAQVADIYSFETDQKFDVFFLLDTLEHLEDHKAVSRKIKQLAADRFTIFGNIPLYLSEHSKNGGFERGMNIDVLMDFMEDCGIMKFKHKVYGINGWPYMWFDGGTSDDLERIDNE